MVPSCNYPANDYNISRIVSETDTIAGKFGVCGRCSESKRMEVREQFIT
jgi:predicted PP-loop superfamily ATPase